MHVRNAHFPPERSHLIAVLQCRRIRPTGYSYRGSRPVGYKRHSRKPTEVERVRVSESIVESSSRRVVE